MEIVEKKFSVGDVRTDAKGQVLVIGDPYPRNFIRIGDTFVGRYEIRQSIEDSRNELPLPDPINRHAVMLTVVGINSMRTEIEELPPGMTGALRLTGTGMEHVTPRCVLIT